MVGLRNFLTENLQRGTKVEVHLHSNAVLGSRGRGSAGRVRRLVACFKLREERVRSQRRRSAPSLEQPDQLGCGRLHQRPQHRLHLSLQVPVGRQHRDGFPVSIICGEPRLADENCAEVHLQVEFNGVFGKRQPHGSQREGACLVLAHE